MAGHYLKPTLPPPPLLPPSRANRVHRRLNKPKVRTGWRRRGGQQGLSGGGGGGWEGGGQVELLYHRRHSISEGLSAAPWRPGLF